MAEKKLKVTLIKSTIGAVPKNKKTIEALGLSKLYKTVEIPDNIEKYLPYYDAVLLENHGALTWSTDLLAAYMKMESVEFYAELLYKSKMLGGPKEFDKEQIAKLYEIRRKMGLPGKHPANLCAELNGPGKGCHSCDAACSCGTKKAEPDVEKIVAEVTKKILEQMK